MSRPKRIAHLWTPEGIVSERVGADWPGGIVLGAWVYLPDLGPDLRPLVRPGRFTGTEFVEYRQRREVDCGDVPELMHLLHLQPEYRDANGEQPSVTRSPERVERRGAARAARARDGRGGASPRAGATVPTREPRA